MREKKLNARQKKFCLEYIQDYNATEAAKRSGYSIRTAKNIGNENLKKPEIKAEVMKLQAEQRERLCISADWVITELVEVYRRCMQQEEVLIWDNDLREKVPSGEYVFDSKGALNALEKLGKHLGIFDKQNTADDNTGGGVIFMPKRDKKNDTEESMGTAAETV